MTLIVSTNFKEQILGPTAFETIFNGGRILIFSGPQPVSADYPQQGTLLGQITANGDAWVANNVAGGLLFDRNGPWVSKSATQTWRLKVDTSGVAGWFRLVGKSVDNGAGSIAAPRIDGKVGSGGLVELTLGSTSLVAGQNIPVQQFLYSIPPIGV